MADTHSIPGWARNALIGIGLFVFGGLLAFGYSYRPLHGALSWKIDALEERLDERNRENLRLSDELARLRSEDSQRIDPETFGQVERELEKTKRALAQAEKDLDRAERKRKEAGSSAARWRKRFEELRDRPSPLASAPAAPAAGGTAAASPSDPSRDAGQTGSEATTTGAAASPAVSAGSGAESAPADSPAAPDPGMLGAPETNAPSS